MSKRPYYERVCKNCGRIFISKQHNQMYCDMPQEGGLTCKEIAYKKRHKRYRDSKNQIKEDLLNGKLIQTDKYGFITRQQYLAYYIEYATEKYHLNGRDEYFQWRDKNPVLDGETLQEFHDIAGVEYQYEEELAE